MRNFLHFMQKQGVVGLAVGFLLGGSVSKMVTALITDIVTPLLGLVFGEPSTLKEASFTVGTTNLMWGDFASNVIDFVVIAVIAYIVVRFLDPKRLEERETAPRRKTS